MSSRIPRVTGAFILFVLTTLPVAASAGVSCTVWIEPAEGQAAGEPIEVHGSFWPAGQKVYVQITDNADYSNQIVGGANVGGQNGTFVWNTSLPGNIPVGEYTLYAFNDDVSCEVPHGQVFYTVTAEPFATTTTTSSTTSTTSTTTTTTTTVAPTTTATTTTTTAAPTTTAVTTTTVVTTEPDDGGGSSPIVLILLGLLGGGALVGLGVFLGRRN